MNFPVGSHLSGSWHMGNRGPPLQGSDKRPPSGRLKAHPRGRPPASIAVHPQYVVRHCIQIQLLVALGIGVGDVHPG